MIDMHPFSIFGQSIWIRECRGMKWPEQCNGNVESCEILTIAAGDGQGRVDPEYCHVDQLGGQDVLKAHSRIHAGLSLLTPFPPQPLPWLMS